MIWKTGKIKKKLLIIGLVVAVVLSIFLIRELFINKQWTESSTLEELQSLPYAGWSKEEADQSKSGVMQYDPGKSFEGYQLYYNITTGISLMDMKGKSVHTWHMPYNGDYEYAIIEDNGDLVAMNLWKSYIRLDWYSNMIWTIELKSHHDIERLPDGTYLLLDKYFKPYKSYQKVHFDVIKHYSENGILLDQWSTFDHLDEIQKYHDPIALDKLARNPDLDPKIAEFDYYHLNTIKVLPDNPLGKDDKRFQQGNWITCLRNADLIVILDKDTKEIVWHWGPGDIDWPHMPYMLDNGDILIFDNGTHRTNNGRQRAYSRVVQVNPVSYEITWEYKADPPQSFFSSFRGSAQRLPNGNTLIAESDSGHVFEVTKQGETVWKFYNPILSKRGQRQLIYRMLRYPKKAMKKIIKRNSKTQYISRKNRIKNRGFEEGEYALYANPTYWYTVAWNENKETFIWDTTFAKSGNRCIKIDNTIPNDSRWVQGIRLRLKPHKRYELSGWIKTDSVQYSIGGEWRSGDKRGGAYLTIEDLNNYLKKTEMISDTQDWTFVKLRFETGDKEWVSLQARLGSYGCLAKGNAWFDDINLKEIRN